LVQDDGVAKEEEGEVFFSKGDEDDLARVEDQHDGLIAEKRMVGEEQGEEGGAVVEAAEDSETSLQAKEEEEDDDYWRPSFPPPPPKPVYEPSNFLEKVWYKVVEGSSLDPNDDGRARRIWGFLSGDEEEDLPLLPDGDPPADAELPKFTKDDFADTTWTVGLAYRSSLPLVPPSIKRTRILLRGDGSVLWDKDLFGFPGKGSWVINEETNVFRFQRDTVFAINGRQWYPTLLASEKSRYYLEGYIIGWSPLQALKVFGLWQAYRDDVPEDERGPAPWEDYSNEGPVLEG